MLRIIDGQIGAGKTYYAIDHILKQYFVWSSELDQWVSRESEVPVVVVTNISDCRLGRSLEELVEEAGGDLQAGAVEAFFCESYQREFSKGRRVVYVIDEAQRLFHRKYFNKDVFFFFQYHRHFGIDIYLITQDVSTLSSELRNLAEYYIQAARRSFSFAGEFRYQFKSGPREKAWKTVVRKRDPRVFAAYQSMVQSEGEKAPNIVRRFVLIAVVFLLITVGSATVFIRSFFRQPGNVVAAVDAGPELRASAAVARAWASWALSYSAETVLGRGGGLDELPPPLASGIAQEWEPDGLGLVVALFGDVEAGLAALVERVDGSVVRLGGDDLVTRCRCFPGALRVGSEVQLWTRPAGVSVGSIPGSRRSGARYERSGADLVVPLRAGVGPLVSSGGR